MSREEELQAIICDYKTVFTKSDAGIEVLKDLARFCGENSNPYVEGSFDRTSQKCGKLSVFLYIKKMLNTKEGPKQTETLDERKKPE